MVSFKLKSAKTKVVLTAGESEDDNSFRVHDTNVVTMFDSSCVKSKRSGKAYCLCTRGGEGENNKSRLLWMSHPWGAYLCPHRRKSKDKRESQKGRPKGLYTLLERLSSLSCCFETWRIRSRPVN